MQGGVGGLKRIQGEPEGVVFRLLPDELLLQAGDLVSQRLGIPSGIEMALNLGDLLLQMGDGVVGIGHLRLQKPGLGLVQLLGQVVAILGCFPDEAADVPGGLHAVIPTAHLRKEVG